jgi:hypothetical protein
MLQTCRALSRLDPRLCPGRWLHRRGLAAFAQGDAGRAVRWFTAAAEAYRRELAVGALARLRVHELMARAGAHGVVEAEALVEIVRRLNRLDRLERLRPPFELADARMVLGDWLERSERAAPVRSLQAA